MPAALHPGPVSTLGDQVPFDRSHVFAYRSDRDLDAKALLRRFAALVVFRRRKFRLARARFPAPIHAGSGRCLGSPYQPVFLARAHCQPGGSVHPAWQIILLSAHQRKASSAGSEPIQLTPSELAFPESRIPTRLSTVSAERRHPRANGLQPQHGEAYFNKVAECVAVNAPACIR